MGKNNQNTDSCTYFIRFKLEKRAKSDVTCESEILYSAVQSSQLVETRFATAQSQRRK